MMLSLAHSLNCVVWKCAEGNDLQECARWDESKKEILLNEDGCKDGYFCRTDNVEEWYTDVTRQDEPLMCEEEGDIGDLEGSDNVYDDFDFDEDDIPCATRDTNQNLSSGSHPKRCSDDSDCLMLNGAVTECKCGMNGESYCVPAFDSDAFEEYWEECEEDEGEINYWTDAWWREKRALYVYEQDMPDCAEDLFLEWSILDALKDAADWGLSLALIGIFNLI